MHNSCDFPLIRLSSPFMFLYCPYCYCFAQVFCLSLRLISVCVWCVWLSIIFLDCRYCACFLDLNSSYSGWSPLKSFVQISYFFSHQKFLAMWILFFSIIFLNCHYCVGFCISLIRSITLAFWYFLKKKKNWFKNQKKKSSPLCLCYWGWILNQPEVSLPLV